MGGGLAVGDDQHHWIVLGPPVEIPPGQNQRVVQVRALDHVPAERREIGLAQFPRVVGEADYLDRILREPAAHQRMQGQRRLLGRPPGTAQMHRVGQVNEQADRGRRPPLCLPYLEVGGGEPHRALWLLALWLLALWLLALWLLSRWCLARW